MKALEDVKTFMKLMGQTVPADFVDSRTEVADHRSKMLAEELAEYTAADPLSVDMLDGLADIYYILLGTYAAMGVKPVDLDYGTPDVTGRKVGLSQPINAVLAALGKRPLCRDTLTTALDKATVAVSQAAEVCDWNLAAAFDRVHEANMKKFWTKEEVKAMGINPALTSYLPTLNRFVVYNGSGKVVKPPSHKPPDLQAVAAASRFFTADRRPLPPATSTAESPAASTAKADSAADPAATPPAPPRAPAIPPQSRNRIAVPAARKPPA